jgi:uncharacterized protein YbjT (DUF2867 family)
LNLAVNLLITKLKREKVTMATSNIIIFGPTGNVASAAARSAQQHGAKVFLAMRDPEKPIPGLSLEQEQENGFKRVQADLTNPETVLAAVNETGAKRAFIYLVFGTSDNMRSSIKALKSAGIEFVVFLSSSGIQGDIRRVQSTEFITWAHAQVEINLDEIFRADGFVAVRPGYFASNSMWWKTMISDGEVKIVYPDAKFDWISPGDIGRVCGTLLADGLHAVAGADKLNSIYLSGPELMSQRDAVETIGREIGKNIKVTKLDEQDGLEWFVKDIGMPQAMAKQMINVLRMRTGGDGNDEIHETDTYKEAVGNVWKYARRQPTRFKEWVDENKQEFSA